VRPEHAVSRGHQQPITFLLSRRHDIRKATSSKPKASRKQSDSRMPIVDDSIIVSGVTILHCMLDQEARSEYVST